MSRTPPRLARLELMACVATLSLTVPVVTSAIEAAVFAAGRQPVAAAGSPAIDPQLRFEVVSVRPVADTGGPFGRYLPMLPRFEFTDLPVGWLVRQALEKPDYQIGS